MTSVQDTQKAKQKYHHGDLKDGLLEAVRQLIEEKGADGFSVAEASRRAGVSTAAPYKHFADREEIVRGVVFRAMKRLKAAMEHAAAAYPARDPRRIVELGRSYVNFARAEPGVFQLIFGISGHHGPDAELDMLGEETGRIVRQLVADHIGRPVDSAEVQLRAYALWCVVHGHSFLHLDGKVPDDLTGDAEDTLLKLVGDAILPV